MINKNKWYFATGHFVHSPYWSHSGMLIPFLCSSLLNSSSSCWMSPFAVGLIPEFCSCRSVSIHPSLPWLLGLCPCCSFFLLVPAVLSIWSFYATASFEETPAHSVSSGLNIVMGNGLNFNTNIKIYTQTKTYNTANLNKSKVSILSFCLP